jgi:hypothetical protein
MSLSQLVEVSWILTRTNKEGDPEELPSSCIWIHSEPFDDKPLLFIAAVRMEQVLVMCH